MIAVVIVAIIVFGAELIPFTPPPANPPHGINETSAILPGAIFDFVSSPGLWLGLIYFVAFTPLMSQWHILSRWQGNPALVTIVWEFAILLFALAKYYWFLGWIAFLRSDRVTPGQSVIGDKLWDIHQGDAAWSRLLTAAYIVIIIGLVDWSKVLPLMSLRRSRQKRTADTQSAPA